MSSPPKICFILSHPILTMHNSTGLCKSISNFAFSDLNVKTLIFSNLKLAHLVGYPWALLCAEGQAFSPRRKVLLLFTSIILSLWKPWKSKAAADCFLKEILQTNVKNARIEETEAGNWRVQWSRTDTLGSWENITITSFTKVEIVGISFEEAWSSEIWMIEFENVKGSHF